LFLIVMMRTYHPSNSHFGVDQLRLSTALVVQNARFNSIGPRNNIQDKVVPVVRLRMHNSLNFDPLTVFTSCR
jgi:hypothetical protein